MNKITIEAVAKAFYEKAYYPTRWDEAPDDLLQIFLSDAELALLAFSNAGLAVVPAENTSPEQTGDEPSCLWCVYVSGSDVSHATRSFEEARDMGSVVAVWPWSDAAHAEALRRQAERE